MEGWMNVLIICFLIIACSSQLWCVCPKEASFPRLSSYLLASGRVQSVKGTGRRWVKREAQISVSVGLYFYSICLSSLASENKPLLS